MEDRVFAAWVAQKSWSHATRYCKVVAWLIPLAALAIDLPLVLRGTFHDTVGSYWLVAWQAATELTCLAVLAADRLLPPASSRERAVYLLCWAFMVLTTWAGVRGLLIGGGGLMLFAAGSTFIAAVICTPKPVRRATYVLSIVALGVAGWFKQPDVAGLVGALVIPFCVVVLCIELDRHTYSRNRELFLQQQRTEAERARADSVLYNALPTSVAEELKRHGKVQPAKHDNTGVLFADLVGFTEFSRRLPPDALLVVLNEIFSTFDTLVEQHGLDKIKTLGDGYMVTSRSRVPDLCRLALDMREAIRRYNQANGTSLGLRIGVHAGPVVAGVIGVVRYSYDVWGDTVNVASRIESAGEPDAIHVSEAVFAQAGEAFAFEPRGAVEIRGRGLLPTYWLLGAVDPLRVPAALTATGHASSLAVS
ncbi:MAG TPA: adenylate/guanylate cyclase domain-containing protein [Ramlibacter sp.]|nr:adenylate/guanylate cyclase domain-containing protein [Ramlibacter sp.]